MKAIIVTGGLGFIGSNLINFLEKKKYFIINIDKVSYSSNFNNINKNIKNYKHYRLNICDKNKISKIIIKYNPITVFNLAAETHVDRSIDSPKEFIQSNIVGTFNLLEAIRESKNKNLKLIHISTDEVYGDIKNQNKSKETDPYKPRSPYSASKASSDHLVKSYYETYGLKSIITNCCNNFGPNQYPEKLIPTIIYNIIKNRPIPIYGKGNNIREWIYVKDHCEALYKISKKNFYGDSFNIGSNYIFTNLEIVKKIIYIFTKKKYISKSYIKVNHVKDRPGHDFKYSLNSDKIKNAINWKCKYNFNEGLEETILWYIDKFNNNFFTNKNFTKRQGLNK